jgi:PAS domain S-box-containing protein
VDCLLVDAISGDRVVERAQEQYPSTPIVAFTPDSAERALEAGATDVVRSRPEETPDPIVQQRIENVCGSGGVPGAVSQEAYTYEDLLSNLSENLRDVIWLYNIQTGRTEFVSAAYEEIWGRSRERLLTGGVESFYQTVHPDDREYVWRELSNERVEAGTHDITYRIRRPDGEVRWIQDRAFSIPEGSGQTRMVGVARDVTAKKQRERELEEFQETLDTVLSNVPMVHFAFDADGVLTRSDGQALERFGAESGDLVGGSVFDVFAHHPEIAEHCRRALDGEEVTATVELGGRWLDSRYQPLFEDGELVRVVGHAYDITDRMERQQQLEQQNDLFTRAQEIADVGAWEYNLEGPNLWTEKVYDIFDIPEGKTPTLDTVKKLYHPADWPAVNEALARAVSGGEPFDLEARLSVDGDSPRWVHLRGEPQSEAGDVVRLRGTVQDITERKKREQEHKRNQRFLEQVQQVGGVGGWEYDFRTDELRPTEALGDLLGLSVETEMNAADVIQSHHPEDREQAAAAVERLWRDGKPFDIEVRVLTGDGGSRWVHSQAEPVYEDGEVVAMRGVSQDIDEQKKREQRLQAERDLVERILETSPVGILVHDADLQVTRANEQAAAIMGVQPETLEQQRSAPDGVEILSADGVPRSDDERTIARAKQTGEPVHDEEFIVETAAGEQRTIVADAVPLFDDGELWRVISAFDDVTERAERECRLREQRDELERLDRINSIIRDVDAALVGAETRAAVEQTVCDQLVGSGRYAHAAVSRETGGGLAPQAVCGEETGVSELPERSLTHHVAETGETQARQTGDGHGWTVGQTLAEDGAHSTAAIPLTYKGQTHGVLTVCAPRREAFDERELDVLDELGGTVGYAIAAVERRKREATLQSLYEETRNLLTAEHPQEVCDFVVETAASVLDPPGVGIFLFDDDENVLDMAAGTGRLQEFYGELRSFSPGPPDSLTWRAFVDGSETFVSDVHSSGRFANVETEARSTLFLPLGEHGVFVVATDEERSFGEAKRQLIRLLAETTEAALDTVTDQEQLSERERQLNERANRVERLESLLSLIAGIDAAVQQAGTREEIERKVCEQLVDTGSYSFAWIGGVPPDGTAVEPRAWADSEKTERAYLDLGTFELDERTPAARAASTGTPVRVTNVTDFLREVDWAQAAVEHGYQSVLAVPLVHEEATYGVLTVYATEPDAFDGLAETIFEHLGGLVPRVGNGLRRNRTVLADRAVELELSVPEADAFPNAVAEQVGTPVHCRQVRPASDGRTKLTFDLPRSSVDAVRAVESGFVTVESLDVIEQSGEAVFRATLAGSTVATTLLSCGAIPGEVVAHPDRTITTVRLPHDADVRRFLDRLDEHYPGIELVSRRDITGRADTQATARHAFAEDLTDRQREVLRTAHERGFFESPREITGVELADHLGVSQPTVTHHLREAQKRLFDTLLQRF